MHLFYVLLGDVDGVCLSVQYVRLYANLCSIHTHISNKTSEAFIVLYRMCVCVCVCVCV